jgi:hypothetical protein
MNEPIILDASNVILNNTPEIKGCLNRNVYSSMLFIFPAIYSYTVLSYCPLMFGSIACLFTSVIHHYYKAKNKYLRIIDKITVNSIALYFIIHCIREIGNKFYAKITYFLAVLSIMFYIYICIHPELYCDYHCILHILSISGIMFYIKSIKTYLVPNIPSIPVPDSSNVT